MRWCWDMNDVYNLTSKKKLIFKSCERESHSKYWDNRFRLKEFESESSQHVISLSLVVPKKASCSIISSSYASTQNVFRRESSKLYDQRYSRIRVRNSVLRPSLNLRLLMIALTSFCLKSFVNVKVRDWLQLTTKQREECIMKLRYKYSSPQINLADLANNTRSLMRQRDEMTQSNAVNANELKKRLK
jgi:hypothetical protein